MEAATLAGVDAEELYGIAVEVPLIELIPEVLGAPGPAGDGMGGCADGLATAAPR